MASFGRLLRNLCTTNPSLSYDNKNPLQDEEEIPDEARREPGLNTACAVNNEDVNLQAQGENKQAELRAEAHAKYK